MTRLLLPIAAAVAIGLAGGAWTPAHAATKPVAAAMTVKHTKLAAAGQAKQVCRDAKGKFEKCPQAQTQTKAKRCRDTAGKFTKCAA